jgi:hypothetical protein
VELIIEENGKRQETFTGSAKEIETIALDKLAKSVGNDELTKWKPKLVELIKQLDFESKKDFFRLPPVYMVIMFGESKKISAEDSFLGYECQRRGDTIVCVKKVPPYGVGVPEPPGYYEPPWFGYR